mmetsp:Transcript_43029/g.80014  ORF Transcript_43029/g.80014 Transcript_43029/m.80014 type:complete len:647 (-) Transcript_43029:104-2044(-)
MMKSALALTVACMACVGYGRRLHSALQLDAEAAAAFNPSAAGVQLSRSSPSLAASSPQVLGGRQDLGRVAPLTKMAAQAVAEPPVQQGKEGVQGEALARPKDKAPDETFGKPFVVGLSHHTASVEVREKLSAPDTKWNEVSAQILELPSIDEAAIISTCNRFEIYVVTKDRSAAERELFDFLAKRAGVAEDELIPNLFQHWDEEATWHILRVAAGLDSLVVGESHILAQMKAMNARATARAKGDEPAGSAKQVLGRLLQTAINSGKCVRVQTSIGQGAVSISSAGVDLAIFRAPADTGRPMVDLQVAVVGAGTMSRSFLMNLNRKGLTKLTLLNRSPPRAEALAAEFSDMKIDIKLLDEFWPTIEQADLVFTATNSRDYLITKEDLESRVWKDGKTPLMLIDISVPRNIEAACDELPNVFSYNVDDLKTVMAENQAKRREAIQETEDMIKKELDNFKEWQKTVHYLPLIRALPQKITKAIESELAEAEEKGLFANFDDKQRKTVKLTLEKVGSVYAQYPMFYLRSGDPEGTKAPAGQIKELVGIAKPQMVAASSEELELYTPVWESFAKRIEEFRREVVTGRSKDKLMDSSFPIFDEVDQMTQRLLDSLAQDTKRYLLSGLVDSKKLSLAQVKEILGVGVEGKKRR